MHVVIIGVTGSIGDLLSQELVSKEDTVRGLVGRSEQRADLTARGVHVAVGDLTTMYVEALAAVFGHVESVVLSVGTKGDDHRTGVSYFTCGTVTPSCGESALAA